MRSIVCRSGCINRSDRKRPLQHDAECTASRPLRSRIWWRQEVPSATIRSPSAAARTAGSRAASAMARLDVVGAPPRSRRRRPCRSRSIRSGSTSKPGIRRSAASVAAKAPKAFWWQWPCTCARAAATGRSGNGGVAWRGTRRTAARGRRGRPCRRRGARAELVAQGQQARGLEADDRQRRRRSAASVAARASARASSTRPAAR